MEDKTRFWKEVRRALISPFGLFMVAAYALTSLAYIGHGWGYGLATLEGDDFIYLLTAEYFSPWTKPNSVAAYIASNSPSPPLFPFLLGLLGGANSFLVANILVTLFMLFS